MTRLPIVGGDDNEWGTILNEYLAVEHNTDGTQKLLSEDTSRTIYVATTGDDTTGDGTASLPYLTVGKAISTINNYITTGVVITINIGVGTFSITSSDLSYINKIQGAGSILIQGVFTLVDSGFTMGSAEADDSFTYAVSGGNTASWTTDQWKFYFLKSSTKYYPITSNTSSSISIAGSFTGSEIYEAQTTLNWPNVSKTRFYCQIDFENIVINFASSVPDFVYSYIGLTECVFKHSSASLVHFRACFSNGNIDRCIWQNVSINLLPINVNLYNNFFYKNFNGGLLSTNNDNIAISYNVFENPSSGSLGSCIYFANRNNTLIQNFPNKFVNSFTAFNYSSRAKVNINLSSIILKNCSYILRKNGASDYKKDIQLNIDEVKGTPNVRWFYDSMYEFISTYGGRLIKISAIYPEIEQNLSSTLTDNATTNVIIGSKAQNRSIIIDYTITRGTTYEAGRLRVIHNGTTLSLTEDTPTGDDVGVTFAVAFNTDEIQLQCALTSTGTGATMTYNANRVMITPVVI